MGVPRRLSIYTVSRVVVLSALLSCFVGGCGSEHAQTTPGAGPDDPRAEWPDEIVFGLIPSEGGTDIVERFAPLIDYLNESLDHPVVPKPASEYAGVITAMQNKQVELAYFGPKSYVEASRIAGAEAIVKELNADGEPGYKSILIVHVDSPFQTLMDVRSLPFAFVTPNSTSGYLVPTIGIIKETGQKPEDYFGEIRFTGSHGSAMNAVAAKDVEVAATNTLDLRAMVNAGQVDGSALRVIWESELIPAAPIAVRRDVPESLKQALREAFLAFNTHTEALKAMSRGGFILASDDDYDIVRLLEQRKAELVEETDG